MRGIASKRTFRNEHIIKKSQTGNQQQLVMFPMNYLSQ